MEVNQLVEITVLVHIKTVGSNNQKKKETLIQMTENHSQVIPSQNVQRTRTITRFIR